MATITGIKFRTPSKVYYFDPGELTPKYNDHVIVETARGLEYGRVVLPLRDVPEEELKQPLKEVIRIATKEDDRHEKENREKEEEAYAVCQRKIREHALEMKLVAAEYTFDNSKLTFYFTADGRVDFRELVKDLAGIFRTRIELRQIGVRDETKIIGGIGICGRPLCCHAYLHDFAPVSIKMAKEQNLSLNPTKISGSCGRLMCCLKNEAETYEYLNRGLPRKGDGATTPDGLSAEIQSVNILRQTVRVIVDLENDEKEMREYPVSEITFVPKKGRKRLPEGPAKEAEAPAAAAAEAFDGDRGDMAPFFAEESAGAEENAAGERTEKKERRPRRRRRKPAETAEGGRENARAEEERQDVSGEETPEDGRRKSRRRRSRRRNAGAEGAEAKTEGANAPAAADSAEMTGEKSAPRRHRRRRSHSRRGKDGAAGQSAERTEGA